MIPMRPLSLLVCGFVATFLALPLAIAQQKTEADKIAALISSVENLKDATFIRNGKAHDAKDAADHLRRKWDAGKDRIKTAREFIKHAASKSSISGQAYKIKFKDGTQKTSEAFLTEKLDELEKGNTGADANAEARPAN